MNAFSAVPCIATLRFDARLRGSWALPDLDSLGEGRRAGKDKAGRQGPDIALKLRGKMLCSGGYPDGFSLSHDNNLEQTVRGCFGSATEGDRRETIPLQVKPLCLVDALG